MKINHKSTIISQQKLKMEPYKSEIKSKSVKILLKYSNISINGKTIPIILILSKVIQQIKEK